MLKFLLEQEFKQFVRNAFLPKLVVIFPCLAMLVFPWVANLEITNIRVAVVDTDRSSFSTRLTAKIAASHYFRLAETAAGYDRALESVERGRADLILEIPAGFERDMMRGGVGRVMISANAVNGTKGVMGSNYMAATLAGFSQELRDGAGLASAAPQIEISTRALFNPTMDYKVFMVPALMVMLLTIICGFLPTLNIVSEKEIGTIEQINVSPVSKLNFILAKLIPYWIIGFVVLSICFLVARLVYGLTPAGSLGTLYAGALLFIVVMSGMGLVISNHSATMQQAMFVMLFFVIVLILMSGLFTPVTSMPRWAQAIAWFNPPKYFISIMRMVYLKGSTLADLAPQFAALGGFALLLNLWAVAGYRKKL